LDIRSGELFGYEALARVDPFFNGTALMFETAERCSLSLDLDRACRIAALRSIVSLPDSSRERTFFINVSPQSIMDRRSIEGLMLSAMKALGIRQNRIVTEVTETSRIDDYGAFEKQIKHYSEQGFKIELDDFGSGHSGLLTLVAAAPPHFTKLDRALISPRDFALYRQKLISAVVAFAANVGIELLGEGIERKEELQTLPNLGVHCGQGFYLRRPTSLNVAQTVDQEAKSVMQTGAFVERASEKEGAHAEDRAWLVIQSYVLGLLHQNNQSRPDARGRFGDFMGHAATGKSVKIKAIHIHQIVDGRIATLWEETDLVGLTKQMGIQL